MSPDSSGTSIVSSDLPRPWKNQLWFSNWIQAAASTLRLTAGLNSSRVISSSETLRALGSCRSGGFSGLIRFGLMLRENADLFEPIPGSFRSFQVPSGSRAVSASLGGSSIPFLRIGTEVSNRLKSRRSSRSDSRFSAFSGVVGSWYHCFFLFTRPKTRCMARADNDLFTGSSPPRPLLRRPYPNVYRSNTDRCRGTPIRPAKTRERSAAALAHVRADRPRPAAGRGERVLRGVVDRHAIRDRQPLDRPRDIPGGRIGGVGECGRGVVAAGTDRVLVARAVELLRGQAMEGAVVAAQVAVEPRERVVEGDALAEAARRQDVGHVRVLEMGRAAQRDLHRVGAGSGQLLEGARLRLRIGGRLHRRRVEEVLGVDAERGRRERRLGGAAGGEAAVGHLVAALAGGGCEVVP